MPPGAAGQPDQEKASRFQQRRGGLGHAGLPLRDVECEADAAINKLQVEAWQALTRKSAVTRAGEPLKLPPKAFDALVLPLRAAPDAVSKEDLRRALCWRQSCGVRMKKNA